VTDEKLFDLEDTPSQVVGRIRDAAPGAWEELDPETAELGIRKLRLAGVYDDRQEAAFMLRTRIPGGVLTADQADVIGGVTSDFAVRPEGDADPDRFVEITTRQDLQLHWIRFQDLPEIWDRYAAVGLGSLSACGDTLRNVTACAVAGLDPDEWIDTGHVVDALTSMAADDPMLTSFLPRKFKVAVTGCPSDCVVARLHDLTFTPARRDGAVGFNVHAGGGLSDYPRLASPLSIFVESSQVPAAVRAVLELYMDRGDFEHKAVNRFRMLVHQLGPATVEDEIRRRLPFDASAAGEELSTWQAEDHLGVHEQRGGGSYVGLCVPLGRLTAKELGDVARLGRVHGDGGIRLTQRQNLVLTGIKDPPALLAEPLLGKFRPAPDPFERAVIACTSAPFCKFGILNVKTLGAELTEYLRRAVPEPSWGKLEGLRIHLSGCKASCAQVQAAHVGLRATMGKDEAAFRESFDVALGGGPDRLGRWASLDVAVAESFEGIGELLQAAAASDVDLETITPESSGYWFRGP